MQPLHAPGTTLSPPSEGGARGGGVACDGLFCGWQSRRLHQLSRQPVEQLWMAGPLSIHPEVRNALDQRPAKMPEPDVIDGHTGREWIVAAGDPFGERLSTAGALR